MATAYDSAASKSFFSLINNGLKYRLFLFSKLPAAFFSGLRIKEADVDRCTVTIRYKWFTKNPFRSTYFACLSMAAEMSTGALGMAHIWGRKPGVSMLVVESTGTFFKKAVGTTAFTCTEGAVIKAAIEATVQSGVAQTVTVNSEGVNEQGEAVARFSFTWSFKAKQ